jgi:hypothetical protein
MEMKINIFNLRTNEIETVINFNSISGFEIKITLNSKLEEFFKNLNKIKSVTSYYNKPGYSKDEMVVESSKKIKMNHPKFIITANQYIPKPYFMEVEHGSEEENK